MLKENALKVNQMTEGERVASEQRRVDRTSMMQQLQRAFGEVVDAAMDGDFSRRVDAEFPDRSSTRSPAASTTWSRRSIAASARPARCWRRWPQPT